MAIALPTNTQPKKQHTQKAMTWHLLSRVTGFRVVRELLLIFTFSLLTAVMTWPYVTRLRDAVAGPGDPYLVSWILWWDYHQTFTDPLNLFHANILYPYRYTLAFSEHCYGVALPFFPLFAMGFRPLTVHAVAMFFGFALSGYAAFRLARTLTGSYGVAWVAGIIFAFVPYRFGLMAQLVYLFSVWTPLLFEALVLFVRERSAKRAAWLGFAFFMTGLTSLTWLLFSILPLAVCLAILLTRHELWDDRVFWRRGVIAVSIASVALLPFTLPYYFVSKMYGFSRRVDDVEAHSARALSWLVAESRNKLWRGMGDSFGDQATKFPLFPGLFPILLALVSLWPRAERKIKPGEVKANQSREKWVRRLNVAIVIVFALTIPAIGFEKTSAFGGFFKVLTSERALALLAIALIARLCLAYPEFLSRSSHNLVETIRSPVRSDTFWVGLVLAVLGFCYSLGWNFFLFRIHYDLLFPFKSIRAPVRAAIVACLGLSLLAGLGTQRLAKFIQGRKPRFTSTVYFAACVLLLAELNAAPLYFIRGAVFPDGVTRRLKDTPMRGGIVVLPAGVNYSTRYALRAADHEKPLITATSGFTPAFLFQVEEMTKAGSITPQLMNVLEEIPTSYLVIENELIPLERQPDFAAFLGPAINAGRLRFINRFDGHSDLYAVVKTEPDTRTEAALPITVSTREWSRLIEIDPLNMIGKYQPWSDKLIRLHVASYGTLPRYIDFKKDVSELGRGVVTGFDGADERLAGNFRKLVDDWIQRPAFDSKYGRLSDEEFVSRVYENAGLASDDGVRLALANELQEKRISRAEVLLKLVDDARFIEREKNRCLVLLHFFAYLGRNPDDPPDNNMNGLLHWIGELNKGIEPATLSYAFSSSLEHQRILKQMAARSNAPAQPKATASP